MSRCICAVKDRRRCTHTIRQTGLRREEIVVQKSGSMLLYTGLQWRQLLFVLATKSCGRPLFALFALSTNPPLSTSEPSDKLLLLERTAMSSVGIRKTIYNDVAETDSASLGLTMHSHWQGDYLGNLHPVVQVFECHGHGLKRQHHALSLQLLPTPRAQYTSTPFVFQHDSLTKASNEDGTNVGGLPMHGQ